MSVGRLDERHASVARRAQHLDPLRLDALAELVDVVDLERQMAEEAPGGVGLLLIPVVGQLDLGRIAGGAARQKDQREAPRLVLLAPRLAQAQLGRRTSARRPGRAPAAWCGGIAWREIYPVSRRGSAGTGSPSVPARGTRLRNQVQAAAGDATGAGGARRGIDAARAAGLRRPRADRRRRRRRRVAGVGDDWAAIGGQRRLADADLAVLAGVRALGDLRARRARDRIVELRGGAGRSQADRRWARRGSEQQPKQSQPFGTSLRQLLMHFCDCEAEVEHSVGVL